MLKRSSLFSSCARHSMILALILASLSRPAVALDGASQTLAAYLLQGPGGQQVAAERGSFRVSENRRKPASRSLELSYVRIPSTAAEPGYPIVYLAGGPGGSATGTFRGARFPLFMKLRELADVILFDQRGTGLSRNGLEDCVTTPWPLEQAFAESSLSDKTHADMRQCVAQWQSQGVDLDGYNTRENAADLKALATALGTPKINLWGISYGSHLAFATLKDHPKLVDRMVLASLEGLDHTIKLPVEVDAVLQRTGDLLRENPVTAEKYPDLVGDLRLVLQQLEQQPQQVQTLHYQTQTPITVGLGKLDVQFALSQIFLRDPEYLIKLPRLVAQMKQGNYAETAGYVAYLKLNQHRYGAMSLAMDAASGISTQRWQRVQEQATDALVWRSSNYPFPDINQDLPVQDLGSEFRQEVKSDIPALFFAGSLDGRTPLSSQQALAANFSQGRLVQVMGAGHNVYMTDPAISEMVYQFFAGQEVPSQTLTLAPLSFE